MKLLILLALVSLATADAPSPTAATTSVADAATPPGYPKTEKGKRTTSAESGPQNAQYSFSDDDQPPRYIPQQYVQAQPTKPQDISYVSLTAPTESKKQQGPETTYNIQYVPAQHVSHSFDILPKYEPATKYQSLTKTQQQPVKSSPPSQNSVIPQEPYLIPGSFQSFTGPDLFSAPHYAPAPTTYLHSLPTYTPGHHIFSPPQTYLVPQHSAPSYSLQPVVMMFSLPGGHYLNTAAGQSALLALLQGAGNQGGAGSGRISAETSYAIPRQQLTYLISPVAHHTASQQVTQRPASTHSQPQQQQQTSGNLAYNLRGPLLPQYQTIKG